MEWVGGDLAGWESRCAKGPSADWMEDLEVNVARLETRQVLWVRDSRAAAAKASLPNS